MTTADDTERFARDRRTADERYNSALTALDRAVVALAERPAVDREDLDRVATALIVFLQQITAFVESKDREIVAQLDGRFAAVTKSLEPLGELKTQIAVVQRAVQTIASRSAAASTATPSSTGSSAQPPTPVEGVHDHKYVAFEDAFRGSDDVIAARVRAYVPLFRGATDVLDIGCGRGELLAALRSAGITARGVDSNAAMIAAAREHNLDVTHADAIGYLDGVADESLGGIVAIQVVEHLEPRDLLRLLDLASRKLRHGAPAVLETINAACWLAFFSSYVRDFTHVRPLHPDTLQYLLRASGFERVEIRYSAPVPDHMKMRTVDVAPSVAGSNDPAAAALAAVAHAVNVNAVILNNLMFTHLDFAAIGYRI
ncbi:MAG TPA: methyltransferase domain-containing protein [Vicinamibacterales bacterium]|jgi:2-polyprenyl-3-methyl-5-hydroxy-6-metoxy-1,4-benzoquinol methylase